MLIHKIRSLSFRNKFFLLCCSILFTYAFLEFRAKYFEKSTVLRPIKTNRVEKGISQSHRRVPRLFDDSKDSKYANSVAEGYSVREKKLERQRELRSSEVKLLFGKASKWDLWMEAHPSMQSLGNIWDKCDNSTRVKIGKVALEPNIKDSGVQMVYLMNMTFTQSVTGGTIYMIVYYKDMTIYERTLDLCEEIQELENPLFCPFMKGRKLNLKNKAIMPSYIPKGRYIISSVVKDQNGQEIGCVEAEFQTGA